MSAASSSSASSFEVLVGLEDSYDQIQKMAIGGMAEIYRARQKNLDRAVAIKRMRVEYRDNADLKERFRREARASAVLLHHNLGHVYDFRTHGAESYIIMEYIDGFDLAEVLERVGALPLDVALMIASKILNGLVHVHAHGMIHRDLKPDNVRISTRGEVKIMDFGIALDPTETNLTMPGVLIGSPHYLSPEQILGAKLDPRVDLFAFGITFYEMLTGKKPFFETGSESVYTRIQKGDYTPPEKIRHDLPLFFSQVVAACLEVNPAKRPSSSSRLAGTINEHLYRLHSLAHEARIKQFLMQSNFLHGNPSLIEVEERTYAGPERREKKIPAKRGWLYLGLGLLGGLILGTTIFYLYNQRVRESELLEVAPIVEEHTAPPSSPPRAVKKPTTSERRKNSRSAK